tara:strand:- start:9415 stop:9594 length:180 start_codon:yes stop_codon:yes gene_type:complete
MLKFTAGAICGWVAARSLPPAPLAPPTLDELTQLTLKAKTYYDKLLNKLVDEHKEEKKK